jgi:hypothetical protein
MDDDDTVNRWINNNNNNADDGYDSPTPSKRDLSTPPPAPRKRLRRGSEMMQSDLYTDETLDDEDMSDFIVDDDEDNDNNNNFNASNGVEAMDSVKKVMNTLYATKPPDMVERLCDMNFEWFVQMVHDPDVTKTKNGNFFYRSTVYPWLFSTAQRIKIPVCDQDMSVEQRKGLVRKGMPTKNNCYGCNVSKPCTYKLIIRVGSHEQTMYVGSSCAALYSGYILVKKALADCMGKGSEGKYSDLDELEGLFCRLMDSLEVLSNKLKR